MSIFRFSRSDRFIKKLILAVSLLLVLAVAISSDFRKSSPVYFQNPVLLIGYWVESSGKSIVAGISNIWNNYINLVRTREQYLQIRKDFDALKGENNLLREAKIENDRLRTLLDLPLPVSAKPVVAQVILRDPSNWYQSLTINKGLQDGVKPGMGVITPSGVVGRILKSGSKSAVVQLITDRNSAVAAMISRTRDQGILEGTVRGSARIKYLSLDLKLVAGDAVVTSGLTPTFPKGIVIGSVIKTDRKPESDEKQLKEAAFSDPFLSAEVVPAVNFSRLEEVMVIMPSDMAGQAGAQKQ